VAWRRTQSSVLKLRILLKAVEGLLTLEEPWGFVEEVGCVELLVACCSIVMESSEGVVPAVV